MARFEPSVWSVTPQRVQTEDAGTPQTTQLVECRFVWLLEKWRVKRSRFPQRRAFLPRVVVIASLICSADTLSLFSADPVTASSPVYDCGGGNSCTRSALDSLLRRQNATTLFLEPADV